MKKLIGIAALAALAACGGGSSTPQQSNQVQHASGPDWVNRGSGAFGGDKGRTFYGVGIASGIRNAAMRRTGHDLQDFQARLLVCRVFVGFIRIGLIGRLVFRRVRGGCGGGGFIRIRRLVRL